MAAWAPDTDSRNAITVANVPGGALHTGDQQKIHLLDGESDPAKVKAVQRELTDQVGKILLDLRANEGSPGAKAMILSNPENQRILHSFGDSFAHVKEDGTHFGGVLGHAAEKTDPDNPNINMEAYSAYTMAIYSAASSAGGGASLRPVDVSNISANVSKGKSEGDQKAVLAEAIGETSAKLVDSPVAGCEWYEACGGNVANEEILKIYGLPANKSPPSPDISNVKYPHGWRRN